MRQSERAWQIGQWSVHVANGTIGNSGEWEIYRIDEL